MGLGDFLKGCDDFFFGEQRRRDEDWERTFGHKIGKPWEKVETYGEQRIREMNEKWEREREQEMPDLEAMLEANKELEHKRNARIQELKQVFEASGRKENAADTSEVETLCDLTEKKIIQQCRRPKCFGCKMGWICPKFHPN